MSDKRLQDRRWWLLDEPESVIYETVVKLMNDDRAIKYALWRELYEKGRSEDETETLLYCEQLTRDNLVANGIDTVHAKLTKSIPRPYFMTIGADWDAAERADLMTKWMDGEAERLQLEELCSKIVKESEITGHAAALYHECPISHRPAAEIVYAEDIHVDPREAFFDSVRTMYRTAAVDREILAERYPDQREAIMDSSKLPCWEPDNVKVLNYQHGLGEESSDMILVVEAWRLPVKAFDDDDEGKPGRDGRGRHVIVVSDLTLFDEEWSEFFFPIVELPWVEIPRQHFGVGLVARLAGSQAEVNRMSDKFYELADLAVPTYWVPADAEVNSEQMDNDGFTYHVFSGPQPPILLNPDPVAPTYMAAMQQRQSLTYSNNGISELGAKSEIPAQLQASGRAMNVYSDIQTERFAVQALAIERFRVESAKRIVAIMERIVDRIGEDDEAESEALEALGGDRHGLEVIKYTDCRMADTPYTVRCVPISKLSNQPSARLQEVDALIQMGLIGNDDALDLLDMHDLDRYRDVTMAAKDDVKAAIQQCKRGKQPKAHSFMPLDYAITLGSQIYSLWHRKGAPDAVLTRLQTFIGMAQSLKQRQMEAMAPPAPPVPPPIPGPPGGMPMDPAMMPPDMGMPPPIPMMPGAA